MIPSYTDPDIPRVNSVNEMILRAIRSAPILILCLASCEKDGGIPGYVVLANPEVRTADGTVIVPSSVTDLWVYANDEPVGVWQVGRRIPVLAEGATNLKVVAGVRSNGITDARIQYPFLATFSTEIVLEPGKEINLQPVFRYYTDAPLLEGFESPGTSFNFDPGDTVFVPVNTDALTGNYSGLISLDPEHDLFRAISIKDPPFANGTGPAFLEIDYRSDTRFLIGVIYDQNGQTFAYPHVFISPTKRSDGSMPWQHVYVDLGTPWGTNGTYNRQFYIQAALENGATSATILMDNIRVVY